MKTEITATWLECRQIYESVFGEMPMDMPYREALARVWKKIGTMELESRLFLLRNSEEA